MVGKRVTDAKALLSAQSRSRHAPWRLVGYLPEDPSKSDGSKKSHPQTGSLKKAHPIGICIAPLD